VQVRGSDRVQVEPRSTETEVPGGDGLPTFFSAGSAGFGEFRCTECGYGIVARRLLPACPMCRGRSWEDPLTSPVGRSRA
jgi:rubrerythrin